MRTAPVKWWSYTRLVKAFTSLSRLKARRQHGSLPLNIYTRCRELPLDVFIDVLINKNLKRLIKHGSAGLHELGEAWDRIFWEYCDLSGSEDYRTFIYNAKDLGYAESKLRIMVICQFVLSNRYSQDCVNALRKFGFNGEFPVDNQARYNADLEKLANRIRSAQLEYSVKLKESESFLPKSRAENITEETFDKALIAMSKFMGFRISRKEITVSEFLSIKKLMVESQPVQK